MRYPFVTPVVGTSFRAEAARLVRAGDVVTLRREADNPVDSFAVAALVAGRHVGYLPRTVAGRLEGAQAWDAIVTDVKVGDGVGIRIRVTGPQYQPERDASPVNPTPDVTTAEVESRPSNPDLLVRSRSGRILGMLASRDDTHAQVRTNDGRMVRYPLDLIETQRVEHS